MPFGVTWEASTASAFWIQSWHRPFPIVRVPFDTATGRFSGPGDTALMTSTGGFDASEDDGSLVYADGTAEYGLWALNLADALKGHFPSAPRLPAGTSPVTCSLSPDGTRLLLLRTVTSGGREGRDIVLLPFQGGAALAHWLVDSLLDDVSVQWMPDGRSFSYAERAPGGVLLVTVDVRSGLRHTAREIPDRYAQAFMPLSGGGWAWWSGSERREHIQPGDAREAAPLPALEDEVFSGVGVREAPSHNAVASYAWPATYDTLFVDVTALPRGPTIRWAAFGSPLWSLAGFGIWWLGDGSLIAWLQEKEGQSVLYRVKGPGRVERLGVIPRSLAGFSMTPDGRRVAMVTRDFRGDIWLAHLRRTGGP